jgi:hypothetical protein
MIRWVPTPWASLIMTQLLITEGRWRGGEGRTAGRGEGVGQEDRWGWVGARTVHRQREPEQETRRLVNAPGGG